VPFRYILNLNFTKLQDVIWKIKLLGDLLKKLINKTGNMIAVKINLLVIT